MSEQIHNEKFLPFNELLIRDDIVYHAIGSDIVALDGIAAHGLASRQAQVELTGGSNSNSPHELAKNGSTLVSVAKPPRPGLPNLAFMTYIEHSSVTFAIEAADQDTSQPPGRGFYDEAFIPGATTNTITGIVLDKNSMDRPFGALPIVTGNISADMVAPKARNMLDHLAGQYNLDISEASSELEGLLARIGHLTPGNLRFNWGIIGDDDRKVINEVDRLLQRQLATGLAERYGDPNVTVLQVVKDHFPDKPVYINDHSFGIEPYDETEYFDTLGTDETIGYERFDGTPGRPSAVKVRRMLGESAVLVDEPG